MRIGVPSATVWQATSLLIAAYMIWGSSKLIRLHGVLSGRRRAALIAFHWLILATQLLNLVGFGSAPESGWVLLGLVGCLTLAGWHFYRLVWDATEISGKP